MEPPGNPGRFTEELPPSYNVAPTDIVYAVADIRTRGSSAPSTGGWSHQAPGTPPGPRPINARAETLPDRPLFRDPFVRRRCLLPADGFYEWQTTADGRKQPYFISARDGGVPALAGLWSRHDGRAPHHHRGQRRRRPASRPHARHPLRGGLAPPVSAHVWSLRVRSAQDELDPVGLPGTGSVATSPSTTPSMRVL
ncbi:MAG: SOS response-associated peptidase family protein [Acidimicrobiia bacterium]